ncbi:MAG: heavy metal-associated domain-containing protein [Chlamydiales bacterium]|nr:heavy metal-associated domain-containing protein [Chlamydiales bacterium]
MTRRWLFSLLIALTGIAQPVAAEIVSVQVSWVPDQCAACYAVLERRLKAIPGVAQADFNFNLAMAELRWKPNQPYDDRVVRTPVAWAGLRLRDVRIKVRGTIAHDDHNVYLVSIGDNTIFPLVSAPKTDNRFFVRKAISTYALDPMVQERLLLAEVNFEMVTIEGILVDPFRPPVHLQVEKIEFPNSTPPPNLNQNGTVSLR